MVILDLGRVGDRTVRLLPGISGDDPDAFVWTEGESRIERADAAQARLALARRQRAPRRRKWAFGGVLYDEPFVVETAALRRMDRPNGEPHRRQSTPRACLRPAGSVRCVSMATTG